MTNKNIFKIIISQLLAAMSKFKNFSDLVDSAKSEKIKFFGEEVIVNNIAAGAKKTSTLKLMGLQGAFYCQYLNKKSDIFINSELLSVPGWEFVVAHEIGHKKQAEGKNTFSNLHFQIGGRFEAKGVNNFITQSLELDADKKAIEILCQHYSLKRVADIIESGADIINITAQDQKEFAETLLKFCKHFEIYTGFEIIEEVFEKMPLLKLANEWSMNGARKASESMSSQRVNRLRRYAKELRKRSC